MKPKPTDKEVLVALTATPTIAAAARRLGITAPTLRKKVYRMRHDGVLPPDLDQRIRGRQHTPAVVTPAEIVERIAAASAAKARQTVGIYQEVRDCQPIGREGDLLLYGCVIAVSEPIDGGQIQVVRTTAPASVR